MRITSFFFLLLTVATLFARRKKELIYTQEKENVCLYNQFYR
jgi:hypothetical protein